MNVIRGVLSSWVRLVVLLAFIPAGCATGDSEADAFAKTNTPASAGGIGADVLRAGDHVRIVYNDIPDQPKPAEYQIPEDGRITLHLGVNVNFIGKRRTEVEAEIQHAYMDGGIYKKITVTIERVGLYVSVGGYVRTPSTIPYVGDMTVVKAVNAAGGPTEYAAQRRVILIRSTGKKIQIDLRKAEREAKFDQPVYPGDTIFVPKGRI